jgi:hypothetical protein
MRVAVSGTHGSGKTTLVEDFAAAHPEYAHVPEPFETLSEAGAAFSDPPTVADYLEQLEHNIETLHAHKAEANVIFDRCPLDFVAYLSVINRRSGSDAFDVDSVIDARTCSVPAATTGGRDGSGISGPSAHRRPRVAVDPSRRQPVPLGLGKTAAGHAPRSSTRTFPGP